MIFENEPLFGITRDGRPMTKVRADQILAECADFEAVESPALLIGEKPEAVLEITPEKIVICAWHDGGRGKVAAERWAVANGFKLISHGQCPRCAAAVKDGTWQRLIP
jgi:hypothetical protein